MLRSSSAPSALRRYSYLQQDWNLLFQQTMELPSEQPHQRILKVQKLIQIHSEFVTVPSSSFLLRGCCVASCVGVAGLREAEWLVSQFANDLIFYFYFGSTQVAEVLGRQIIEELNLPPEKRTITPEQGIGEAGGTKYILVLTLSPPNALLVSLHRLGLHLESS